MGMQQLRKILPVGYTEMPHELDLVYLTLSRLVLISDDARNIAKVDNVLKFLLQMWLNSASFTSCAKKSSLSQLCSLLTNLMGIEDKSAARKASMTATSTLLFFVQRARELGLYN